MLHIQEIALMKMEKKDQQMKAEEVNGWVKAIDRGHACRAFG
jgi:hypothetical protein